MPRKRRKEKRAVIGDDISLRKVPHYLGNPNIENRHIVWRFSASDNDGPFSCNGLDADDLSRLWERLRAFEKMNVSDFKKDGSYHAIPVSQTSKEAKNRLAEIQLDDIDTLYSFRITQTCRLWCMKHENIMSVLWWDKSHEVYLVGKKGT